MGASRPKHRFWKMCRVGFRRFRITILLLVFIVLATLIYLNQVGLPGFLKRPLLETLRSRGLDLQYSRLHLSWYRGIVADNVHFGQADDPLTPLLKVEHARVQLNHRALLKLKLQVDSVTLLNGELKWPLSETNQLRRELVVDNIQTHLRFLPDDEWVLDNFRAQFGGAKFTLLGKVTHASSVREWGFLQSSEPATAGQWRVRLNQLADFLESTQFSEPPEFKLDVRGDARDLQSFSVRMMLNAPGAITPWGTVHDSRLTARLEPATNRSLSRISIELEAADAQSRWANTTNFHLQLLADSAQGQTNIVDAELLLEAAAAHTRWAFSTNLHLNLRLLPVKGETNLVHAEIALRASRAETKWASASEVNFTGTWSHSLTNAIPLTGSGQLSCKRADSQWARADGLEFSTTLNRPANQLGTNHSEWGPWTNLAPYQLTWDCRLVGLQVTNSVFEYVALAGSWLAPELLVTNLSAQLDGRRLEAQADLNVDQRTLAAHVDSKVNPDLVAPLLPEAARHWLSQFTWEQPPEAYGEISLVLPAWTNSQPDWLAEIQPTLKLDGQFKVEGGGTYRNLSASGAHSQFIYTNMCWCLPDLVVTRPEGSLRATHRANDRTKDFCWKIQSTIDPAAVRPILGTNEASGLDIVSFSEPPVIEAEILGRGGDASSIGIAGRLAVTNFSVRGQWFSGVQASLAYTNKVLQVFNPTIQRGTQHLRADGLTADFVAQQVYVTNGSGVAEPLPVARAIGTNVGSAIEPYEFAQPVAFLVGGTIPMHGEEGADLRFSIDGSAFHWNRFHVPQVAGDIHWAGLRLELTNIRMDFYGGKGFGSGVFEFPTNTPGTDYSFVLTTTNTILQDLMADYFHKTNWLQGTLNGNLVVTKANSEDWRTVNGYGSLALRDGYIWDVPIFGVFSPILDSIIPGLGKSRANSATCTFLINKGSVHSSNLESRAPTLRLQYRGDMDLEGGVQARVEAELLRDVWLVGPLVSTVFWPVTKMFEYKVTGTVEDPKIDPVYIVPKLMMLPFQPFRTLKGLFPDDSKKQKRPPPEGQQPQ
jgi:hypothetical protein